MKNLRKLLAAFLALAMMVAAVPLASSAEGEAAEGNSFWNSLQKMDNLALSATAEGTNYLGVLGTLLFGVNRVNDGDFTTVWRSGEKGNDGENATLTLHWTEKQQIACFSAIWVSYYPDLPENDGYKIQVTDNGGNWVDVGIISSTRTELGSYIEQIPTEQTQGVDMSMFTDVVLDVNLFGAQETKDLRVIFMNGGRKVTARDGDGNPTAYDPEVKEYPMANEVYCYDNDVWTVAINYLLNREAYQVDENGKLVKYYDVGAAVTFPEKVKAIGANVISDKKVTTIEIASTITGAIDPTAFIGCENLAEYTVAEGSDNYAAVDGVLYNSDMTRLISYPKAKKGTSFTVPETVTEIGEYAFAGAKNLTSVELPESLALIGDYAFADTKISVDALPETLEVLGTGAFMNSGVSSVYVPASVGYLRANVFANCTSLVQAVVDCTEIGYKAFAGCASLERVAFSDDLTAVANKAFDGCYALDTALFGGEWDDVDIGVGNSPLVGLSGGTVGEVNYSPLATATADSVVDGRSDLSEPLAIDGDTSTRWQSGAAGKNGDDGWLALAWDKAYNFTKVTIEWEVSRASTTGFVVESSDDGETWTAVPASVGARENLGSDHYLDTVTFTNSVNTKYLRVRITAMENSNKDHPSIYEMTCYGEGIVVEEPTDLNAGASEGLTFRAEGDTYTVTGIGTCTDTEIVVPSRYNGKAVTKVAKNAFKDLSAVTSIRFSEGIEEIADSAMKNLSALETVSFPSSLTKADADALSGCSTDAVILTDTALTTFEGVLYMGDENDVPVAPINTVYAEQIYEYTRSEIEEPVDTTLRGDVNVDGEVNADDLTALARHVGAIETITDTQALKNADCDLNKTIEANDLTALARHVGGIEYFEN